MKKEQAHPRKEHKADSQGKQPTAKGSEYSKPQSGKSQTGEGQGYKQNDPAPDEKETRQKSNSKHSGGL